MQVSEIMSRDVESIDPGETIEKAARLMAEQDVGSLPVCEGRRVVGIVTDRDIVVRGLAEGKDSASAVREIITEDVETVGQDEDIEEVHDRMAAAQIRRLPVVDDSGELIGMVALADLARSSQERETGATLEEISEPMSESRTF